MRPPTPSSRRQAPTKGSRQTPYEAAVAALRQFAADRKASPVAVGRILGTLVGTEREAAASEAGIARRSAFYLAAIARAVDAGLMEEADVEALGWARARVLASQALRTKKKVSRLAMHQALGEPARLLAANPSNRVKLEVVQFSLTPRQAAALRKALALHGASAGSGPAARAAALTAICTAAKPSITSLVTAAKRSGGPPNASPKQRRS